MRPHLPHQHLKIRPNISIFLSYFINMDNNTFPAPSPFGSCVRTEGAKDMNINSLLLVNTNQITRDSLSYILGNSIAHITSRGTQSILKRSELFAQFSYICVAKHMLLSGTAWSTDSWISFVYSSLPPTKRPFHFQHLLFHCLFCSLSISGRCQIKCVLKCSIWMQFPEDVTT